MKIFVSQAAKIYAQALSELTVDMDILSRELEQIEQVFNSSRDLMAVLSNSSVNFNRKKEIIEEIFKGKINEQLVNFLLIIIEKHKIGLFKEIHQAYKNISATKSGIQTVEVVSAIDLNDDYKKRIVQKLEGKLGNKVQVQWDVSSDIIAGLVFKINDTIVDSSLKSKIEKFSNIMK